MRRDRRELLELGVGAGELGVGALELRAAALERVGHRVEAARELAELVLALVGHARRQVAGGQPPGRLGHGPHRAQDRAAQVQREAQRDHDDEPQPTGAEPDRSRRALLGLLLTRLDDVAFALEQTRELVADRVELRTSAVGSQLAARRGEALLLGDLDEPLHPEVVVLGDPLVQRARPALLARIVGDELGEAPGARRVHRQLAADRSQERRVARRDVAVQPALDRQQRLLELVGEAQRLLGAKRHPRGVALAGDRDDQHDERGAEQQCGRGADRHHLRRDLGPEAPSQHEKTPT